ncbi:MAG: hypothetical protein JOZ62_10040, partial [Acidobacteriaceae bacterium]|nr:hypothetical protein [Acidobacteriaceae bacterium]
MIPELRKDFNARWTPELYRNFLRRLDECAGTHVEFRCNETPVFLPKPLLDKIVRYGSELYGQLASNPAYREASESAIPKPFRVPNEAPHPLFVQADFGLVRAPDGEIEPKLVEIQGFPSIYGLQAVMADAYRRAYQLDPSLRVFLDGLDESAFFELLKHAILAGHDPENVVLLEIDPFEQKTLPDFLVTRKRLGIRIVNIRDVKKQGRKLNVDGIPIERIYNRVIVD